MGTRLPVLQGDAHWRGPAERTGAPALPGEFPPDADEPDGATRRTFLQLLGASAALAGCGSPAGRAMVPYAARPIGLTPGVAQQYATSLTLEGYAVGVRVRSNEGRPTYIHGNPLHPASLGAVAPVHHGALLQLYDPERARVVKERGRPRAWADFLRFVRGRAARWEAGAALRFLAEPTGSPLLADLRARLRARYPNVRFHAFASATSDAPRAGGALALGEPLLGDPDYSRAAVILSLDSDFLSEGPQALRDARRFASTRAPTPKSRLYVVETTFTLTGAMADHRARMTAREILGFALALAGALGKRPGLTVLSRIASTPEVPPERRRFLAAVAQDLERAGERAVVVAGPRQPPELHAATHAINAALGSLGTTVQLRRPPLLDAECGPDALLALAEELRAGQVDTLVIDAWNPVYAAPPDLSFERAMARAQVTVYTALYDDETAERAGWFIPAAHPLESWGDARAPDGTVSFLQPLTEPLFGGVSTPELYAALAGEPATPPRERLRALHASPAWERWLEDGMAPESAAPPVAPPPVRFDAVGAAARAALANAREQGLEIHFRPSPAVHDGRFANCAWLQELPHPMTKEVWGNAALLSPATARALGVQTGDVVILALNGRAVEAPALVLPGHADGAVTVELGYGRRGAGENVGRGVGFDAGRLRRAGAPWIDRGLSIERTGRRAMPVLTQEHWRMEGRPLALQLGVDEDAERVLASQRGPLPALYGPSQNDGYRWAMAIDLSRCTGCSACVVACQAENNIPVVGAEQVAKSREMHWLRLDRYFVGGEDDPKAISQPVMCVHCEQAPCEYVCPVNATVHSDEGLNEMIYNRCVGTRYCSNNCPYKVRRFNYLEYNYFGRTPPSQKLRMNPDVTVRSRGVMEKCTYCVQRIQRARIAARGEGRRIRDGEVIPACAESCPTEAIIFGSLDDLSSRVSRLHQNPRSYALLHGLNTHPRTVYLARVKNPNPELG